ncbi:MAG: hypothetical protein AAFQ43_00545 [Bacteroidota bacterium]
MLRSLVGLFALALIAPLASAQPTQRPEVFVTIDFREGAIGERRAPARLRVRMAPEAAREVGGVRSVSFHATRDPKSPGVSIAMERVRPDLFRARGMAAPPPAAKAIMITMGDGTSSFLPLPDEVEPGHYPMGPLLGDSGLGRPQMDFSITIGVGPIVITIGEGPEPKPEPKEPEGGEGTDPDRDSDEDDDVDTDGRP